MATSPISFLTNPFGAAAGSILDQGSILNNLVANPTGYITAGINNLNGLGGNVLGDSTTTAQKAGGSGGAGTAGTDLSSYDQGIDATNAQINNLDPVLNNLLQGVYNNYQTTVNGLNQAKTTTDQTYKTNKADNAQSYNGAKNDIRTNTGTTISGVDRILGSRGGGGQAAGNYAATLAAKAGTQQLQGAGTSFGKNEQGLDTNYHNFTDAYNTNLTAADDQRAADENGARANISTQKANLLQNLASLINERTSAAGGTGTAASQPYVAQAKDLLSSASVLGAPKSITAKVPMAYTPPTLDSYTVNPTTVTPGGNNGAQTDSTTPFWSTLLNRNKQLQAA